MTRNQLEYRAQEETRRNNRAIEEETHRHNVAVETRDYNQLSETARHNLIMEQLQDAANRNDAWRIQVQQEYNKVSAGLEARRQEENERHNLISEQNQVYLGQLQSQTNRVITAAELQQRDNQLAETNRHNLAMEEENYRHNVALEIVGGLKAGFEGMGSLAGAARLFTSG